MDQDPDPHNKSPELSPVIEKVQKENVGSLGTNRRIMGFTTANGKPVKISEKALQNAKKLFEGIDAGLQSPTTASDQKQGKKSFQEMEDGESENVGPAEKKVKLINEEEEILEKSMHQQELDESISALLADDEWENDSDGDGWTGIGQEATEDTGGDGSKSVGQEDPEGTSGDGSTGFGQEDTGGDGLTGIEQEDTASAS